VAPGQVNENLTEFDMSKRHFTIANDAKRPRLLTPEKPLLFAGNIEPANLNVVSPVPIVEEPPDNGLFSRPFAELIGTHVKDDISYPVCVIINKPVTLIGRGSATLDLNCWYNNMISHIDTTLHCVPEAGTVRLERVGRNTMQVCRKHTEHFTLRRSDSLLLKDGDRLRIDALTLVYRVIPQ
jgi:hypothetical protein